MKSVKFDVQDILGLGLIIVVTGIALAYGLDIQADIKDDFGEDDCGGYWNSTSDRCQVSASNQTVDPNYSAGFEYNATGDATLAVSNMTAKLPTVSLVIIASILIGVLVTYMYKRVVS